VKRFVFVFAVLFLASAATVYADPIRQNELSWLQIMAFAAHQTDYSGIFVYQYGNHIETSRLTHVTDRDGEHGRLESLDGPRREVIRNNNQVWCYSGGSKVSMEQRLGGREFPALLPAQLNLLNKNYQIKSAEEVRLAGFHAHAMVFQPKDNFRYVHKMWADSVSGLLLKSEVLDEHGRVIEQYSFIQLSIGGDIDRSWITANDVAKAPRSNERKNVQHSKKAHNEHISVHEVNANNAHTNVASSVVSGWRVDGLPAGFKKIAEVRRQLRSKDAPVIQMVFSDGLAGISVFIEKSENDQDDLPSLSSQGVIQVYSRLVDGQLITVVGEVPPRTVMRVADSVRNGRSQ